MASTSNAATNKNSPAKATANAAQVQSTQQQSQSQTQPSAQGAPRSTATTVTIAPATPTQPAKNAIVVANTGQIVQGAQVCEAIIFLQFKLELLAININNLINDTGRIYWWAGNQWESNSSY